ncbi:MAG: hypothetical protein N5P05_003102 [Chroococcopsis gigantea SAG 12.99]|jgi:DNA sulfur modification protein DndD|nr:DNA sulfur modification protein DndD [Chlorogloea purpurea SAG 13.99]MDV3001496.1 hypothetical protein [Chroococcopsis gigantea SAG 12.99]
MIFTELILQNFGPYRGRHVINLTPESGHDSGSIILFGGMNGGGKTTLMDAIRLALYGARAQCSSRNNLSYSQFLNQCVYQQAQLLEPTRIELAFQHIVGDEWREYRVVRYWHKKPQDNKDTLGVLDENWPDSALANVWDEYIETLLPLAISNLFLFDGEQVKDLAEQDIPSPTLVKAIQSLLGLELVEKLDIDLDVLVGQKRRTIADAEQLSTMAEIEKQLSFYIQESEQVKAGLETGQEKLAFAQKKYENMLIKLKVEGGKIANERHRLESQKKELQTWVDETRRQLCELAESWVCLYLINPLLYQAQKEGKKEILKKQAKLAQALLEEREDKLVQYLNTLSLTGEQLSKIEHFLSLENQKLYEELKVDSLAFLDINEEELQKLEIVINTEIPIKLGQFSTIYEGLKNWQIKLETANKELNLAPSPEEYDRLNQDLKIAEKEYIEARVAYDNIQTAYSNAQKNIERTKKELNEYSEREIDQQTDEQLLISAKKVKQTLQIYKERLSSQKIDRLEREITECFRYLLHKSNLVHRIGVDRKNFSLSLYDTDGEPFPKQRLSAGEKQLLAIAFLWGLARVSGRQLPIAIDTPLGRLDSSHRQNLIERYFPSASHQVILLSTDTEIARKEVQSLRNQGAISREYLLEYKSETKETLIHGGCYFF